MDSSERQGHLFVVRIWQEPSSVTPPGQWRGSVTHVPSGQRKFFLELAELNQFMLTHMQDTPPSRPQSSDS